MRDTKVHFDIEEVQFTASKLPYRVYDIKIVLYNSENKGLNCGRTPGWNHPVKFGECK